MAAATAVRAVRQFIVDAGSVATVGLVASVATLVVVAMWQLGW